MAPSRSGFRAVRSAQQPVAYVGNFRSPAFGHRLPQENLVSWLGRALVHERGAEDEATRLALGHYARLAKTSGIESRVTCVPDFTHECWERMSLYGAGSPCLERRMATFDWESTRIVARCFSPDDRPPTHLVQISCTGYRAPSAAQRLVSARGWSGETNLLSLGHMGCYAALPALAMASGLVQARAPGRPRAPRVSLVFLELCTLHFDARATRIGELLVHSLFADGAARCDVEREPSGPSLAALAHREEILPGSAEDMGWTPSSHAFVMDLGRRVPELVGDAVQGFVERLVGGSAVTRDIAALAIHPGGPKILERVAGALDATEEQTRHARAVFRLRGNMSSSTLPQIWQSIVDDPEVSHGALVLSLAFGPGLTLSGNLLRKWTHP